MTGPSKPEAGGPSGWTRLVTSTGRYEYQFQGSGPAVRAGRYLASRDFQFLVMDEEGWLYRIPVRVPDSRGGRAGGDARGLAEERLRAGLERIRPRADTPYEQLDAVFAVPDEPRS